MNSDLFDLQEQTAIVVGGTGVLGGRMAEALAEHGASVAIIGRNRERGVARIASISDSGGKAVFVQANAVDRESLLAAKDRIEGEIGVPNILVNATGGNRLDATLAPGDDFCELPLESWKSVVDLNLVGGALLPCQIFGSSMLKNCRGSIINIASMSGMIPLSRVAAYSASKAAVINLTKFLAREWATVGVRVNSISPGFFPAEQNRALLFNDDGGYTDRGKQIIGHTPMARFGDPKELDGAVVWLASEPASSFVTGQNIVVDGGFASMTI